MNRPGPRTLLLGSRLTAPPILLGSAWYTWQWWQAGGTNNLGLLSIALFLVSAKATCEVAAYRQWRTDWQAMGPGGDKPSRFRLRPHHFVRLLAMLLAAGLLAYAMGPDAPLQVKQWLPMVAMGSAALGVLLIAIRLARRIRWPHRQSRMPVVAIAVRRPVLKVPGLAGCYRRLPDYCQQLLKASRS